MQCRTPARFNGVDILTRRKQFGDTLHVLGINSHRKRVLDPSVTENPDSLLLMDAFEDGSHTVIVAGVNVGPSFNQPAHLPRTQIVSGMERGLASVVSSVDVGALID